MKSPAAAAVTVAAAVALALGACATPAERAEAPAAPSGPKAANAWAGSAPTLVESFGQASPRQFGELRLPAGKGPFPVAMLIHGGCWLNMGSTANMVPLADWLRERGVATWNVDYREVGSGGGWPASFDDWASGLAALKTLAGRHPLDLTRITTIGHSAGALPASWLASGSKGDGVVARDLPDVRAAVILDGPIELAPFRAVDQDICGSDVIDALMGGTPESVPARYDMVDPRKNPPAIKELVVVDAALPAPLAASLDAIRARGTRVEVLTISQDQHFDLLKPGTADFEAIAPALLRAARGR